MRNRTGVLVVLIVWLVVSSASAQSEVWSGLVFGLPEEAAGVALYVVDVELMGSESSASGGAGADLSQLYERVASGELNDDGTFTIEADAAEVLARGKAVRADRFFTVVGLAQGVTFQVTPEDAHLSLVTFGVEDEQGVYLGSLAPREASGEGLATLIMYPFPVMAHEPTLVEGAGPDAEVPVVFDLTMPRGLSLVRAEAVASFFDSQMRFGALSEAPREWLCQNY